MGHEPGTGRRGIDNFESFMRLLAPVERDTSTDPSRNGERIFSAIEARIDAPIRTTIPMLYIEGVRSTAA